MPNQIKRVLIANRGEIAVRIIRACRELGLETVQVFTEADRNSMAVQLADMSLCIGAAASSASYLRPEILVGAALQAKADAIHPGYGFLSENAEFSDLCAANDIIFIGPTGEMIRNMGDKATARKLAKAAGVPTTPGSDGKLAHFKDALEVANKIGYPVLMKASAGGGGKGMRVVHSPEEMENSFQQASREAMSAFGDDAVYLEKYLPRVRHIEIQVLGDGKSVIHFWERDCSIQRRNQKLLEESPSPRLPEKTRLKIAEAAVKLCKHVHYTSAGTIEFIYDEASDAFYFIEMNTRIQVEHPVTELVTGFDLVKAQIKIAGGEPLELAQDAVRIHGHAIECRINAENFEMNFMPSPGAITSLTMPGGPGVRMDSHIFAGYVVPPYYDSLVGKLICWGSTRAEAIARMSRALGEMKLEGIKTTIPFHQKLIRTAAFETGDFYTRYVEEHMDEITQ